MCLSEKLIVQLYFGEQKTHRPYLSVTQGLVKVHVSLVPRATKSRKNFQRFTTLVEVVLFYIIEHLVFLRDMQL